MPVNRMRRRQASSVAFADAFIRSARAAASLQELGSLMEAVTHDMGFRHYALIHHEHPEQSDRLVDLKRYPDAITERLFGEGRWRRDPIMRSCQFADGAFLWNEIDQLIRLDRHDLESLEFGRREGLNVGITVPSFLLGDRLGSCTFAGSRHPGGVGRYLGPAQVIGTYAFQAARRLVGIWPAPAIRSRLQPRQRDCIILGGRGMSNKEIARALGIAPASVDGYITEAREILGGGGKTKLAAKALIAGEISLFELYGGLRN